MQFAIDKKVGMEAGGSEGDEKFCNHPVASDCMTTLASIDAGNQDQANAPVMRCRNC